MLLGRFVRSTPSDPGRGTEVPVDWTEDAPLLPPDLVPGVPLDCTDDAPLLPRPPWTPSEPLLERDVDAPLEPLLPGSGPRLVSGSL